MRKIPIFKTLLFVLIFFSFYRVSAQNKNNIEKFNFQKPQFGFFENNGQIHDQNFLPNPEVKYMLCLGNGMNVQLKGNSFSYDTYKPEIIEKPNAALPDDMRTNNRSEKEIDYYFHRVDIEFVGSNINPQIIAEEPSTDYQNYYNAVTPECGATNVHFYKKILYKDLYPGIDLEFTAKTSAETPIEYTFIVHPGADAKQIKLHYIGANQTQLIGNKINIDVVHGRFTESIPASWIMETKGKIQIEYLAIEKDIYGFAVPTYPNTQTLIIDPDPNLDWGTYYGGSVWESNGGITCDGSGNIYVTGTTKSINSIATNGAYQTVLAGGGTSDAFLVKFNSSGVRQWGTYYGGSVHDAGYGITCDGSGNIFIGGITSSPDGIATIGAHQTTNGGGDDAFIAKFNGNGVRQWATYCGGSGSEAEWGITCDGSGNVIITGYTASSIGIATAGAHQAVMNSSSDAFAVKFNASGVRQWGTYYGGNSVDWGTGIDCDGSGNVFVTGFTMSYNGIATNGAHQDTILGFNSDAFLVKFNNSGVRQWGTYYGGNGGDEGYGVSCDGSNNVIITGNTGSANGIATVGAYQEAIGVNYDAFIAKFNGNGVRQWGTYYGGDFYDYGYGICSDNSGNIVMTGYTSSVNGIATSGAYQTTNGGGDYDAFIAKFTGNGVRLWGTFYGGGDTDKGHGISIDGSGNVLIIGETESTSGIATVGAHQTTNGGMTDLFIGKFSSAITGFPENESPEFAYLIYPNPVKNELIISTNTNIGRVNFEIFNSIGQLVLRGEFLEKAVIQTSALSSGFYLIKFQYGNSVVMKKLIKE